MNLADLPRETIHSDINRKVTTKADDKGIPREVSRFCSLARDK